MLHVVVVGGGLAGLVAAEAMARGGIQVTVVERAPQRAGACSGPASSQFLEEFQVAEMLVAQRVHEIALVSPTQRTAFLTLGGMGRWAGSLRRDLLLPLFKRRAEEAGVTFKHGTFMRFRHGEGDYPALEIRLPNGEREQVQADVVIGADGASSRVARALGLPALPLGVSYQERFTAPEGVKAPDAMQLHFGRKISADTYGWLSPHGDQVLVGVATAAKYGRRLWTMQAELKKRLGDQLNGWKSVGAESHLYPMAVRPKLAHDRILLVGDAAGLVTAGTLDGLYYACKSGLMAAEVVIEHQHVPLPERLAAYQTRWQAAYGEVFAAAARMEQAHFANDRAREILVDMAWDREAQRLAVDAYLSKRRFAPPLGVKLRLKARQVSQLVKARVVNTRRQEPDVVSRSLPVTENYLDLALRNAPPAGATDVPTELTAIVPEAQPAPAEAQEH